MKKQLVFLLSGVVFSGLCLLSPQVFAQIVEDHNEYYNADDLLYPNDQRVTSVAAYPLPCVGKNDQLDFFTAHSALLDLDSDWTDEGFVLSALYKDPQTCEVLNGIEQILVDMKTTVDDFNGLPVVLNDEIIYDLKVDENLNLIGCGTYSYVTDCSGNPQVFKPPVIWPFYFKYNTLTGSFDYFKRIARSSGDCNDNPVEARPLDIEILNEHEFVICMNGTESGLAIVDCSSGKIVATQKYTYGRGRTYHPVDIEVTKDRIYAIGRCYYTRDRYSPSILAVHHDLQSPALMRYHLNGNGLLKPELTAIRYNPETESLLTIGYTSLTLGELMIIQVEDLYGLSPNWMRTFYAASSSFPPKLILLGPTYGLEYLRGEKRFVFHTFGSELGPISLNGSANLYHYLVEVEDADGTIASINRLADDFNITGRNPDHINNTLVQSYRTDHLGLVFPQIKDSPPTTPIGLFTTERYYQKNFTENCMVGIDHDPDKEVLFYKVKVGTVKYDAVADDYKPDKIWYPIPKWENLCQSNGTGLRNEEQEILVPDKAFSVSPNPSTAIIHFNLPEFKNQQQSLKIFSAQGQLIEQINISPGDRLVTHQIGYYLPGMYMANLIIGDQQQESVRFIVLQ